MTAPIPPSHADLLQRPVYVVLTTLMPDGQPQSSVVWCDYDGQYVRVNSARGRQKDKNMRADPRVTVLALDPQDPFRWLEVRGVVAAITAEGAVEHIHALSRKYTGQPYYGGFAPAERQQQETRVLYAIQPVRVVAFPSSG